MTEFDKINNPHDRFFKEVLSKRQNAIEFFTNYLPKDILPIVDFETLVVQKDSFIEKELNLYYSDLLYRVNFRESPGFLYLLFEHQSTPDNFIGFRLLRYMIKIWEQFMNQYHFEFLPPIVPLVLYHGVVRWDYEPSFMSLINSRHEELKNYIPDFKYILYDLSKYSDEDIKGIVYVQVMLLLFKYILKDELDEKIGKIIGLMKELSGKRTGLEFIETVIRYIYSATDKVSQEQVVEEITKVMTSKEVELMATIAEKLIQQGETRGEVKRARQTVIEVLETKFEAVSTEITTKINQIEIIALLEMLLKNAVKVKSIEEFEDILKKINV